jgi:hypothetical protein
MVSQIYMAQIVLCLINCMHVEVVARFLKYAAPPDSLVLGKVQLLRVRTLVP